MRKLCCWNYTFTYFDKMSYSPASDISARCKYPVLIIFIQLSSRKDGTVGATIKWERQTNIESTDVEMTFIFYVSLLLLYSFVPGPRTAVLRGALQKAKFFQDKKYVSRAARGSRDNTVRNFTRYISHTFKNGEKVIKTVPKWHNKESAWKF